MSKHPTERVRTVQELQATSMQQADKALRRMAAAEERLARLEGRLAERDELIAEFREAYGRQADTITALTAVVREVEAKAGRGVDQVFKGLEGRIKGIEDLTNGNPSLSTRQIRAEAVDAWIYSDGRREVLDRLDKLERETPIAHKELRELIQQAKPKRGRPKGSKNKPKDKPEVVEPVVEVPEYLGSDTPGVE